jgi:catechol 2,3-dioxygenase
METKAFTTRGDSIAGETGMGPVHVAVTDGAQATRFYEDFVGLRRLPSDGESIRLGVGDRELVVLHPGASAPVVQHRSGLYHFALVVPGRHDLAVVIKRLALLRYPQSPTDHVLTKSDYFWDPDGNGIEIYTETPEDGEWFFDDRLGYSARDARGRARSGRDPIDLKELFSHLAPDEPVDEPLPVGTHMGHVHLHVRHLDDAVEFYSGLVGFDLKGVSRAIGMAFVSAGGYHHHIGLNTWAGEGAPPAPAGTAGLRHFTVEVPSDSDLEGVAARLSDAGLRVDEQARSFEVRDPSENLVRFVTRRAG